MPSLNDGHNDVLMYGDTDLAVEAGWSFNEDKEGLITSQVTWRARHDRIYSFPQRGSSHPFFPQLYVGERAIKGDIDFCRCTCTYYGIDPKNIDGTTERTYAIQVGTGEEPIETHDKFNQFAGSPQTPKNDALFVDAEGNITDDNKKGIFKEFAVAPDGPVSPFAGVTSFLDATNITWSVRWTSFIPLGSLGVEFNAGDVGKISSPEGPCPSFPGRNWLFVGLNAEHRTTHQFANGEIKAVYSLSKEWRLSGRKGWNAQIYG